MLYDEPFCTRHKELIKYLIANWIEVIKKSRIYLHEFKKESVLKIERFILHLKFETYS